VESSPAEAEAGDEAWLGKGAKIDKTQSTCTTLDYGILSTSPSTLLLLLLTLEVLAA
jgi:hypothetical protein